ncbi:TonB-dependent siderophore receptor [Granulicella sp. S156]|uniref:TonB-dependent siderophore receptor n=1 Tax=Granulicella sp. S156 TaxID=1747224 RepID=UPI0020B11B4F|nr:TonB-dependent siderophore receptor [Granulicella sp. S156]
MTGRRMAREGEPAANDKGKIDVKKKSAKSAMTCGTKTKLVALATAVAYATAGRMDAMAQQTIAEVAKDPAPAQLPVRRFHVVEGALAAALEAYQEQSGVTVKLEIPAAQLAGFKTSGVSGLYANDSALRQLLAGSGLSFKFEGSDTVSIGLRHSDSVDVTAGISDSVSMSKFTESLLDTPQSVSIVPQFVLKDEQNRTLMDAVRNVPGISLAAGESGAQGDSFTIRGFTARNDIFLDGIRDFGSYYRDSFNFDQIEVLEGPAGVQFGRGSTGGVVNEESKVPAADEFVNVQAQVGTDLTRRVTADINEPLPDLAEGAAFRLNAMANEGGVAGRPYAENRRFGLAPSISFGLNSPTRLTISYFHFTESDTPDYGLPWFFNRLAPGVNRHSYFGFPDENFLRTSDDILTLKANHAFSEKVDVHTIARWANYPRDVQITEPQICSNATVSVPVGGYVASLPTSAVNTGVTCPYTFATPPAQMTVNRNQIQVKSVEGDLWDQTEVTAHFKVAHVRNDFAGGVEGGQEISNPIKTSYTENKINSVTPTNLVTPNPHDVFSGTGYISSITHVKSMSAGLYFVDTMKLGRFIELSGGVRWDYFDTLFNLYAPATGVAGAALTAAIAPISQTVHQPSYRAAAVFKPNSHGSVYFDWGTSFDPSAETLSLSVATSVLPPEENESYEVGAKYSFLNERLRVEGAWFRTEQDNARETDPNNSNNIVLAGNQRVKGVQASAVGQLGGGLNLVLGYAYLDSAVLASKEFPSSIGYQLANVPRQTFNFFLTHNLPFKLSAGFGGNYVASRTASSTTPYVPTSFGPAQTYALGSAPCATSETPAVTTCYQVLSTAMKQVPGYWVFNAMVKRPITDRLELQANVYNLLNRFYIDQPHPSHLIPGAGLSALIGANFRF